MYKLKILAAAVPAAFAHPAAQGPVPSSRGGASGAADAGIARGGRPARTARARAQAATPAPDSPSAAAAMPRELHAARRLVDNIDWAVAQPRLIALGVTGVAVLVGAAVLAATAPWALLAVTAGCGLAVAISFLVLALRHELRAPRERPLGLGAGQGLAAATRAWKGMLDAAVNWALPDRPPEPLRIFRHLVDDFEGTARDATRHIDRGVAGVERFLARWQ